MQELQTEKDFFDYLDLLQKEYSWWFDTVKNKRYSLLRNSYIFLYHTAPYYIRLRYSSASTLLPVIQQKVKNKYEELFGEHSDYQTIF